MNRMPRIAPLLILAALAACSRSEEKPPEIIRPVLSVVVEPKTVETFGFAGSVEPQYSADLAFRPLGRVVSRAVKVGDLVSKGTTIAALEPAFGLSAYIAPMMLPAVAMACDCICVLAANASCRA